MTNKSQLCLSELENLSPYYLNLVENYVDDYQFKKMGNKTTICLVTLKNGYEVVGTSGCVDPKDYNEAIGQRCALKDALTKVDPLIGFIRQQKLYELKFNK